MSVIPLEAWIALLSLFVAMMTASIHQVIHEMAWHDLEDYCRLQRRPELFGRIIDLRDEMALGSLMLQAISSAVAVVFLTLMLLGPSPAADLPVRQQWAIAGLAAFLLLVVNSWIPWAIARTFGEVFLFHTWRIWWVVAGLAWPLTVGARLLSAFFMRAGGLDDEEDDDEAAFEEEILSMVSEGEHDGLLQPKHADMIEGVMELDNFDVDKIMTPRNRVDAIEVSTSWEDAVNFIVTSGRTRIPVYRDTLDNIVGILYAKDVLRESMKPDHERRPLEKLIRKPLVVPASTRLDEMLRQFLERRVHMAIVMDEYGRVAGVVTIEDILEEIVGEIFDETDKDDEMDDIRMIHDNEALVSGTTHINRLNEALGLQLPEDEEYDTVAGLIMAHLNEIPRPGREIQWGNVKFRVEEANRRSINSVRVMVIDEEEASTAADSQNKPARSG